MTAESPDAFEALTAQLHDDSHMVDQPDGFAGEAGQAAQSQLGIPSGVQAALEAILLVAEQPVAGSLLAQLLEVPAATIDAMCDALAAEFAEQERGFTIVRVAGGYRFQTTAEQAPYVERFLVEGQSARLSAAALETLAIVAYKQPISRAQIASIRGVNVDGVVRTLQQRGYVAEVARDPGPGNAVLYGTTRSFLERLGLDHLGQLPSLGEFVPDAGVVETLELALRSTDDVDDGPPEDGTQGEE